MPQLAVSLVHLAVAATRPNYAVTTSIGVRGIEPHTPLPIALHALDAEQFPSLSRARKSLRRGEVLLNGRPARCATACSPGDLIELQARVAPGYEPRGEPPFALDVVYEDDSLAVVYKPAGVVTHPPKGGAQGGSMRTAIQYALAPPPAGSPGVLYRPHCCHRLDRPTTGLLLCAKTKPVLVALQRAFAERRVKKRYVAIVAGAVRGDAGEIDADLDDKSAVTGWEVRRRVRSLKLGHITELVLSPRTGRTHQLRRHCAEVLGCPIVGDTAYGGANLGSGLFLCACSLELEHPAWAGGPPLRVECEPPEKHESLLRREQQRWERLSVEASAAQGLASSG